MHFAFLGALILAVAVARVHGRGPLAVEANRMAMPERSDAAGAGAAPATGERLAAMVGRWWTELSRRRWRAAAGAGGRGMATGGSSSGIGRRERWRRERRRGLSGGAGRVQAATSARAPTAVQPGGESWRTRWLLRERNLAAGEQGPSGNCDYANPSRTQPWQLFIRYSACRAVIASAELGTFLAFLPGRHVGRAREKAVKCAGFGSHLPVTL